MSQCHAICRYLGEEFGLSPDTKEEKARADQLSLTCHDYIAEGQLFLLTLSGIALSVKLPLKVPSRQILCSKSSSKMYYKEFQDNIARS